MDKRPRPPAQFVETEKQARAAMNELYNEAYVQGLVTAVDTEFVPVTQEPVLMSYSWGRGVRRVVRAELVREFFGDWLADDQARIAYQNYKEDAETLGMLGLSEADLARSFYVDVMVAGVLRDETLVKHSLKAQQLHFLRWFRREYGQLFAYVPSGKKKAIVMDPRQVMDDLPPEALECAVLKWGSAKGGHKIGPRDAETWRRVMVDYAGDDAEGTQRLAVDHRRYLRKTGYWDRYEKVDREFTLTLMFCEDAGALVDKPILRKILRKQEIRIMRAEHCFRAAAGDPKLNLRSGPQMKKLLIDEWGWPEHPTIKTDSGGVSMDKEVLNWWLSEHRLEMARVKLAFNNASTMKGTFLEGILTGVSDDGRLRSDLNQIGAKTSGRISSRKFDVLVERSRTLKNGELKTWVEKKKAGANLQNIPARKEKDPDGIRGAFRAPRVGEVTAWGDRAAEPHKLLVADYSGFHLMLVIHFVSKLTRKSAMLDIMKKYGTPSAVHVYTTIQMFKHVPPHRCSDKCRDPKTGEWKKLHGENKVYSLKEMTMDDWKLVKPFFPDQYTYSKNVNFSLIFMGSPWTLAYNTGRDANDPDQLEECKRHYDDWYDLYPEIPIYQRHMVDHAYEHGWVPTIGGRRGHLRKMLEGCDRNGKYIDDEDKRKKLIKHAERVATNTPAQGCLHGDTLVLTAEEGLRPIREVSGRSDLSVWDGTRWAPAGAAPSGKKRELMVRFHGGLEVRCSPDHRFMASGNVGKRSWKTPEQFGSQQYVVLSDDAGEWHAAHASAWPTLRSKAHNANDMSVLELRGFDRGLFLGRVASDGWVREGVSVRLMVAEHEKSVLPRLRELCAKIGKTAEYRRDRSHEDRQPMYYLELNSAALTRQLGSLKGYVPPQVMADSDVLRGYLCGLFDGDGTVGKDGAKLTFGGGHRYLAWAGQVQQALFFLGIRSRITIGQESRVDLSIQKADTRRFAERVGFLNRVKQRKLEAVVPSHAEEPRYGRVLRVQSVTDTGRMVEMYDVVDSSTSQFAAAGVVTHNSEADIVKMAMNLIRKSEKMQELRAAPLFPVHDEIVVEAPESTSRPGLDEQVRLMKQPYREEMEFELAVEGAIGDNWIDAKP